MDYRKVFSSPYSFFVVIHVLNEKQAMENVEIAIEVEVDGIFLINHQLLHPELFEIGRTIKETFPGIWMGINCLDLTPHEIFSKIPDVFDGVWVDNAGIRENDAEQEYAEQTLELQKDIGWKGLYFGGVAFKYQKPVNDLEKTAKIASHYMDVVTTSGPGTGMAPETPKIRKMADAIESNEKAVLGIALGITLENVEKYHYASCFLAATGVSDDFNHLNPERVRSMVETLDRMNQRKKNKSK